MGFIANLVPREGKFFEYFDLHASRVAEASSNTDLRNNICTRVGNRPCSTPFTP